MSVGQLLKIVQLANQSGADSEQYQKLLASGIVADIWKANVDEVDRQDFRRVIGLIQRTFRIKLGTGLRTADDFRRALREVRCKNGDWADDILGKPDFAKSVAVKETEVDIGIWSTSELTGKKEDGTTAEVFAGAKRLGLEKCPAEMGPQLRLQYKDQPNGERILIGMKSITNSGGALRVFGVRRDDFGLWLDSYYSSPARFWNPDLRWVFVRPRK